MDCPNLKLRVNSVVESVVGVDHVRYLDLKGEQRARLVFGKTGNEDHSVFHSAGHLLVERQF